MAVLIPDIPGDCPNSERYIYERLGRELPDAWIVLHSLGLAGHEKKIWGEADITILSERGIFVLEVKGGSVTCKDGVWRFGGDFTGYIKRESPWAQAFGCLGAVRERLRRAAPAFREVLFGIGVVMPYTTFTATGAEIIPEVLLDRRSSRRKLDRYVQSLEKYWKDEYLRKHRREYRGLSRAELRQARQILRPDVDTALSLGGYLTGLDERMVQLTNEQVKASRRMAANPRTVVRGSAGTGKSVIAQDRARRLAADGRRVLYLCFNRLLAAHVRDGLKHSGDTVPMEVHNVHALYREIIERAGLIARLEAEDDGTGDFFATRFPELAAEALCERRHDGWDVLVVDEAQDLLTPEHLDVFDLLLDDGLRRGRWHLFLDPLQNIFSIEIQSSVEERLAECAPAFDDLYENCRNTRQVAVQASIVSGIDLAVAGAPDGPEAEIHYYKDDEDAVVKLEDLLRRLVRADVRSQEIAILSSRRAENSLLASRGELAGLRLAAATDEPALCAGGVLFTTMHAFKGLERQAVIAVDMAEIGNELWSMLHYTGLSRARSLLHVLAPVAARKAYKKQAQAFGRRLRNRTT